MQQEFKVRVYQPVVTEWKTELSVPAESQRDANEKAADVMKRDCVFPPEWIKREYLVEGTEKIPDIHGNECWTVEDQEGNFPDLDIAADTSKQRAFGFGKNLIREGFQAYDMGLSLERLVTIEPKGILVAEPVMQCSPATKPGELTVADRSHGRMTGNYEGCTFWWGDNRTLYRIIWIFTNPQ